MSRKFIKVTSGWIPVSVLMLLAVALVTGAEGTGLLAEPTVSDVPANGQPARAGATDVGETSTAELHRLIQSSLRDVDSVRQVVATLGRVPARVELIIDAGISSGIKSPGSPKRLQGFDHE